MSESESARGAEAVRKLVRPRSVAILGASAKQGSISQSILHGLKDNDFQGPVYLVGRSTEPIDGRQVLSDIALLPDRVDLAVITLPAGAVRDAIAGCTERKVGAALVLAAGFAETGANDVQDEVAQIARNGGLAICGPNCIGYTNNVDGLTVHMRYERVANDARKLAEGETGVAFVGQSGGIVAHMQKAAHARGMAISYVISTGNEAGLDLADYLEFLIEDAATSVVALYAEQIRRPAQFIAMCKRARIAGKTVMLLHPGRNQRARAAAQSHTGALVGDHGAMLACVAEAGVLVVETMDELIDISELFARYPEPSAKGAAVLSGSGAFIALINDFAERLDLEFPQLTQESLDTLKSRLPPFGVPSNPLDTTGGLTPGALSIYVRTLLSDPNVGSLLISFPIYGLGPLREFIEGAVGSIKPVIVIPIGDGAPLTEEVAQAARTAPFIFGQSADRALRALAQYGRYGKMISGSYDISEPCMFENLPPLSGGPQVEWKGKRLLRAIGIRVPEGALACSEKEAIGIANGVGYPVALKAQSAALTHKTEAGGVILGITDDAALRVAWQTLNSNLAKAMSDVVMDGALVERMAPRGLELMIGSKRDPSWGSVLLFGLGGIWVEALGDVRLLPATASHETIVSELHKLRTAVLLTGFRGAPPIDVDAVASAIQKIGRLMLTSPSIQEIDINPLVVYAKGKGVIALDALVISD